LLFKKILGKVPNLDKGSKIRNENKCEAQNLHLKTNNCTPKTVNKQLKKTL